MATYETLKAIEGAISEENELRYLDAVMSAATLSSKMEIPGLYSDREIACYVEGVAECLSVAFDNKSYEEVRELVCSEAEDIMHGSAYMSFERQATSCN